MPNRKPDDADLSGIENQGQNQSSNIGRGADIHSQHQNSARAHKADGADANQGNQENQKSQSKSGKNQFGKAQSGHQQSSMVEKQNSLASKFEEFDFESLEELERKVESDQHFQQEFKKDPSRMAKEEGVELPQGFKISFNEQFARDKSSSPFANAMGEDQKSSKIEIRMGHLIIKE